MALHRLKSLLTIAAFACASMLFGPPIAAQHAMSDTTDPDQIAAECGGTAGAGEAYFQPCAVCHALNKDAPPLRGPHLEGIF